jgi:hypothetical protein
MQIRRCLIAFAVAALLPAAAMPQSLADVARAEEARRKTVKQKSKTYTNDDLVNTRDGSAPETPPATGAAAAGSSATPAAGAGTKPASPDARDEQYWKKRIDGAQQLLNRNKVLLAALESRVNALNTDFVNMDDPAQRTVIQGNLQIATAELTRVKQDMANATKTISDIQEEARKANVPPGWLR